jgi:hypothetical protein
MNDFVVIDFYSQIKEIIRYTRYWTSEEILNWLAKYGEVKRIDNLYDDSGYSFQSKIGIRALFRLTENAKFFLVDSHTIIDPNE